MSTKTDTRDLVVEIEIDASAEAVWNALTDADALARWFPESADVEPGEGGVIRLRWGTEMVGANRIEAWEPGRHLRTGWWAPGEGDTPGGADSVFNSDVEARRNLVVDYFLESRSGKTVLRLVHSGFSTDASWDEEYAGHGQGWRFELCSLRNYLEHHQGKIRHLAWVRTPIHESPDAAWAKLAGREGLVAEGSVDGLKPGDGYAITTVHGDRLAGAVVVAEPPRVFGGTVPDLDHSLMRAGIETCYGRPEAWFWLSTWGAADCAASFEGKWRRTLDTLFPA